MTIHQPPVIQRSEATKDLEDTKRMLVTHPYPSQEGKQKNNKTENN